MIQSVRNHFVSGMTWFSISAYPEIQFVTFYMNKFQTIMIKKVGVGIRGLESDPLAAY